MAADFLMTKCLCLHAVRWCKSLGAKADDVGAEEVALSISTKTDAPEPAFTVGMKVRARFAGKGHFYPARISKCNTDGTYDLTYLDGDWEEGAKAEHIVAI